MSSRRLFLQTLGAGAAAMAAPVPLPTVKFNGADVTRLVVGSNPLYGYSHFNSILDGVMREWMTPERRLETVQRAEAAGINTWQFHYHPPAMEDLRRYRAEGGRMNWLLLLSSSQLQAEPKLLSELARLKPLGIAHHGNRSDDFLRTGQMNVVHDFVKAVQDAGMAAGISCHNPKVVEYVEEHGWKNDYYMTCMYWVSRTVEESRREFGEAHLGEQFSERDPERMCRVVRATSKTCFAFKVLGAGRNISSPKNIERAVGYVLANIKPRDAMIVGTFPKFKDEMRENAELVRRLSSAS